MKKITHIALLDAVGRKATTLRLPDPVTYDSDTERISLTSATAQFDISPLGTFRQGEFKVTEGEE